MVPDAQRAAVPAVPRPRAPCQFSGIFASGLTPIIAAYLIQQNDGQPWLVCAYVVFATLVSMLYAMAIGRSRMPDAAHAPAPA